MHEDIERVLIREDEIREGIDRVAQAITADYRGSDFTVMEGALEGTTLPARVATLFLGLMRLADVFMDGLRVAYPPPAYLCRSFPGGERWPTWTAFTYVPWTFALMIGLHLQVSVRLTCALAIARF